MIVSIHQPLYLPWQPYFGKIACSDVFIFLDDVQYPVRKSFFNRNIIKGANGPIMLTVPVTGRGDMPLVKDIRIASSSEWQTSHWRSITLSYSKAPYFSMYADEFEKIFLKKKWDYLCELNFELICRVTELLKLKTKFIRSSTLGISNNDVTQRLIDIVQQVGGLKYLTGTGEGSMRYMDENKYSEAGIQVLWHSYIQTPYTQCWREFLPDTCILDLMFNCGPQSSQILVNSSTVRVS